MKVVERVGFIERLQIEQEIWANAHGTCKSL